MIVEGVDTGNVDSVIEGLVCAFGDVGKEISSVLKKSE